MNLNVLRYCLLMSWDEETATGGKWSVDNPSWNQCAVTALVVQDYLGGALLRCPMTDGDSHYWNKLDNGMEVDLTTRQFDFIEGKPIRAKAELREREYVLSFPDTVRRYELLKSRVEKHMKALEVRCCLEG